MKISLLQENLLKGLSKVNRAISSKAQLPILQNFLLSAQNNNFIITGTNMEMTIKTTLHGKIEEEGEICIPAKIFVDLVASLPKDTVTLTTDGEKLMIECKKTKASIPGLSAKEFPPTPETNAKTGTELSKEHLISALYSVLFSAATDESRPLLTGVKIEKNDSGTTFISTDGYRLSVKSVTGESMIDTALVIPARALIEVVKIAQEEKEQNSIRLSETVDGQLLFFLNDSVIATRRIDGEYPNYQRIIPKTHTTEAILDVSEFTKAVKSAAVFARDNAGIIRFSLSEGSMIISSNTPQVGENVVEIDAKLDGEGGTMAVNSRFLMDLLNNFQGEQILFQMTGSLNPAVFKLPGDESYLHIIMPVRVQE